jgi:hypothetical protein
MIVPRVGGKPQALVSFDGVHSAVLKLIRAELIPALFNSDLLRP